MNCREIQAKLPLLTYGELDEQESAVIQQHMRTCQPCSREYREYAKVRQLLGEAQATSSHTDLVQLYRHVAQRAASFPRRRIGVLSITIGTAAAILLLLAIKVELRFDAHQMVVRWGVPPNPVQMKEESSDARESPQSLKEPSALEPTAAYDEERIEVLKDLVHALAADFRLRDKQISEAMYSLQQQLITHERKSDSRWRNAERDAAALYTAVFRPHENGD